LCPAINRVPANTTCHIRLIRGQSLRFLLTPLAYFHAGEPAPTHIRFEFFRIGQLTPYCAQPQPVYSCCTVST
jgi:hypothetical protein